MIGLSEVTSIPTTGYTETETSAKFADQKSERIGERISRGLHPSSSTGKVLNPKMLLPTTLCYSLSYKDIGGRGHPAFSG